MKGMPFAGKIYDAPLSASTRYLISIYSMQPARFQPDAPCLASQHLRTGIDVVEIGRIDESLQRFGTRFMRRLFRDDEIAYALSADGQVSQRLAARFAAKEAAIKAFGLSETGVAWRDIEVRRQPDGACSLALHGRAAERATELGVSEIALSLSHDGDYAAAVVTAISLPAHIMPGAPGQPGAGISVVVS
jgi:holo-[acyl-carrier protein] synthase